MQPEFLLYPQLHPSIGGKSNPWGQVGVSRVRHLPWAQKSREHPNPQSYRSIIFDTKFLKIKINAKKSMRNNTSKFYKNRLFWFVCFTTLGYFTTGTIVSNQAAVPRLVRRSRSPYGFMRVDEGM